MFKYNYTDVLYYYFSSYNFFHVIWFFLHLNYSFQPFFLIFYSTASTYLSIPSYNCSWYFAFEAIIPTILIFLFNFLTQSYNLMLQWKLSYLLFFKWISCDLSLFDLLDLLYSDLFSDLGSIMYVYFIYFYAVENFLKYY